MLKNKIVAKKIRNIVILLMTLIIMIGAYSNIRRSKAENVIPISMEVVDKNGVLSAQTLDIEARETTDGNYLLELPKTVKGNFVTKYYTVEGEEIPIEINGDTIALQLTEEEITNQKVQLETDYDKIETDFDGEEITLYNKELKYSQENEETGEIEEFGEVIVTGYMPLEMKMEFNEIDLTTLTAVKLPNEKETMKKAYEISVFKEVEVVETVEVVNSPEESTQEDETLTPSEATSPDASATPDEIETPTQQEGGTETTEEIENVEGTNTGTETTTETTEQENEETQEESTTPKTEEVKTIEKVVYDPSLYGEELQVKIKYSKNEEIEERVTVYNLTEDSTKIEKIESTLENEKIKFISIKSLTKYIIATTEVEDGIGENEDGGEVSGGLDNSVSTELPDVSTTTSLPSTTYTTPYLPDGYSHVQGTDLNTGLVIQDSKGNQFVWIEVPKTSTVYRTAGINLYYDEMDSNYDKIVADLMEYTSTYSDEDYSDWANGNVYDSDVSAGLTEGAYGSQLRDMIYSVYLNGGFYIGRYETGISYSESSRESADEPITQTPVIKQDAYPYTYVTATQAQTLANSFETVGYTSSLMYGIQWDLVLRYLESKGTSQADLITDSTSWGNKNSTLYNFTRSTAKYSENASDQENDTIWNAANPCNKTEKSKVLLTTGANSTFSKQNISDLFGNVSELTLEINLYAVSPTTRGGNYGSNGNYVSYRGVPSSTAPSNDGIGFRVALWEQFEAVQLKSTASETSSTSGFLGNTSIQRKYIESVTFLSDTNHSSRANAVQEWDVSKDGDGSILAWYTGSRPYQVYIASERRMAFNDDSRYLFSYIGYDSTCTATEVINNLGLLDCYSSTKFSRAFQYTGYNAMKSLDLSDVTIYSGVDLSYAFYYTGYKAMTSLNLERFNSKQCN